MMARVLLVEDDPNNLRLATLILESGGHTVVRATRAAEAESALAEAVPDLIVMDLGLPDKDGYTLTRELRGRRGTSKVPILALTAFAMPGDARRALAVGCTSYLTKPVRRAELLARVAELLEGGPSPTQG
jgi:two-component system cell cycle response regulator DivK